MSKRIQWDTMINRFKEMGLNPTTIRNGNYHQIDIKFNKNEIGYICRVSKDWQLGSRHGGKNTFNGRIEQHNNNSKHPFILIPDNQTHFFNIIEILITTDKTLRDVYDNERLKNACDKRDTLISELNKLNYEKYRVDNEISFLNKEISKDRYHIKLHYLSEKYKKILDGEEIEW